MPVDYSNYPATWNTIRGTILLRAGYRCEQCGATQYEPHPETGSRVVLTISHTDHDITNNDPTNLRALCQRCHLRHDARLHAQHATITRRQRRQRDAERAGQHRIPTL